MDLAEELLLSLVFTIPERMFFFFFEQNVQIIHYMGISISTQHLTT